MPKSHCPRHLADKSKSGDLEGGWPLAVIVKNHPGISVVVMQQFQMQGPWLGNSPDQLEKNLLGIYQASAGPPQMPSICSVDAPHRPLWMFFPREAPVDHRKGIYRASGGGLQMFL